jgi:hypothetical protein
MATDSPIHSWIRFWLKRNDREFEERAKRKRKLDEAAMEKGMPSSVVEACAHFDRECHQRNQFPVGAFFDSIKSRLHGGRKSSVEKLMMVAEAGADLFYDAICTADDEDNAEFFVEVYGRWGPVVDAVLEECDRDHRNTWTGRCSDTSK